MGNLWCVLFVTAGVKDYKKGTGVLSARFWAGQQQELWGRSDPGQYSLCQGSRQTPIRAILSSYMKELPQRRKHLETFLGHHAPSEDG